MNFKFKIGKSQLSKNSDKGIVMGNENLFYILKCSEKLATFSQNMIINKFLY